MSKKHKIIGFFPPFKHFAPTQSTRLSSFKSGEEGGGCGGGGVVGNSGRRWVSEALSVSVVLSVHD